MNQGIYELKARLIQEDISIDLQNLLVLTAQSYQMSSDMAMAQGRKALEALLFHSYQFFSIAPENNLHNSINNGKFSKKVGNHRVIAEMECIRVLGNTGAHYQNQGTVSTAIDAERVLHALFFLCYWYSDVVDKKTGLEYIHAQKIKREQISIEVNHVRGSLNEINGFMKTKESDQGQPSGEDNFAHASSGHASSGHASSTHAPSAHAPSGQDANVDYQNEANEFENTVASQVENEVLYPKFEPLQLHNKQTSTTWHARVLPQIDYFDAQHLFSPTHATEALQRQLSQSHFVILYSATHTGKRLEAINASQIAASEDRNPTIVELVPKDEGQLDEIATLNFKPFSVYIIRYKVQDRDASLLEIIAHNAKSAHAYVLILSTTEQITCNCKATWKVKHDRPYDYVDFLKKYAAAKVQHTQEYDLIMQTLNDEVLEVLQTKVKSVYELIRFVEVAFEMQTFNCLAEKSVHERIFKEARQNKVKQILSGADQHIDVSMSYILLALYRRIEFNDYIELRTQLLAYIKDRIGYIEAEAQKQNILQNLFGFDEKQNLIDIGAVFIQKSVSYNGQPISIQEVQFEMKEQAEDVIDHLTLSNPKLLHFILDWTAKYGLDVRYASQIGVFETLAYTYKCAPKLVIESIIQPWVTSDRIRYNVGVQRFYSMLVREDYLTIDQVKDHFNQLQESKQFNLLRTALIVHTELLSQRMPRYVLKQCIEFIHRLNKLDLKPGIMSFFVFIVGDCFVDLTCVNQNVQMRTLDVLKAIKQLTAVEDIGYKTSGVLLKNVCATQIYKNNEFVGFQILRVIEEAQAEVQQDLANRLVSLLAVLFTTNKSRDNIYAIFEKWLNLIQPKHPQYKILKEIVNELGLRISASEPSQYDRLQNFIQKQKSEQKKALIPRLNQ